MNFDIEIKSIEKTIESKLSDLNKLLDQFNTASEKTKMFLNDCHASGYTKISIGKRTDSIPHCKNFPFGCADSVFGFMPKTNELKNTWPPIWGICSKKGIANGAGNGHQQQADTSKLIDGVYHLRDGIWKKVE